MTSIAKLLVFLNLLFAVLIVSWSTSLYVNRVKWLDSQTAEGSKVDGRLTELKADIQDANKRVGNASALFGDEQRDLLAQENLRSRRLQAYNFRLSQARSGLFTQPVYEAGGAVIDITKPGTVITTSTTDTTPLPGIDKSAEQLRTQADEIGRLINGEEMTPERWMEIELLMGTKPLNQELATMGVGTMQQLLEKLSKTILAKELAVNKQREVLENLKDESPYLESTQVNWISQLETLKRRKAQLQARLDTYNASAER